MKSTVNYIFRVIFYLSIAGILIIACNVSSKLNERTWDINLRYRQVYDAVYKSEAYNTLDTRTKEEMGILDTRVTISNSIMQDVETQCIVVSIFISLVIIALFIMDSLSFFKNNSLKNQN
jgi:hypothetical protein